MTARAYVLIQTDVGCAEAVATAVAEVAGVAAADIVAGPYDVIVRVESATEEELGRLIVSGIPMVPGITRTTTCNVVHL